MTTAPPGVENAQTVALIFPPMRVVAVPPVTVPEDLTSRRFVSPRRRGALVLLARLLDDSVAFNTEVSPVAHVTVDVEASSTPLVPIAAEPEQPLSVSDVALPFRAVHTTFAGLAVLANAAPPGMATARAADPAMDAQTTRRENDEDEYA